MRGSRGDDKGSGHSALENYRAWVPWLYWFGSPGKLLYALNATCILSTS